jgi:Four helix bundle sensory module for signal transduction
MNIINNLKLGVKLTGSFLLVALIIVAVAATGYTNMKHINDSLIDGTANIRGWQFKFVGPGLQGVGSNGKIRGVKPSSVTNAHSAPFSSNQM